MFYSVFNSVFTSGARNGAAGPCKQNKNERQTWPPSTFAFNEQLYNKPHLLAFALVCSIKSFFQFSVCRVCGERGYINEH